MSPEEERRRARDMRALRRRYWLHVLRFGPARKQLARFRPKRSADLAPAGDDELIVASLIADDPSSAHAHAVVDALSRNRSNGRAAWWSAGARDLRAALLRARSTFAAANLRLVVKLAHRFRQPSGLPLPDLVQEGTLGLLNAVDRFDPDRNVLFSSYASRWVFYTMTRALANRGRLVRVPTYIQTVFFKARKRRVELREQTGREPTLARAAASAGITADELEAAVRHMRASVVSTDADPERQLVDRYVGADDQTADPAAVLDARDRVVRLRLALDELPQRQRDVILRRFGLGDANATTFRELGEHYGLSGERIRQIQVDGLQRLRACLCEVTTTG